MTRKHLLWINRKNAVLECINETNPDIILVQEVSSAIHDDLVNYLYNRYGYYGNRRSYSKNDDESVGFFLKKSLFKDVKLDTIWLTNTPYIYSRQFDSLKPRIATCITATLKGQQVHFINTHLDPLFPWVRNRQMNCLMQTINLEDVLVLGGDFNGTYSEKWFSKVSTVLHWVKPDNLHNTLHYGNGKISKKKPIDYLFVNNKIQLANCTILDKKYNNTFPSDHFPIYLTFSLDN